MKQRQLLSLLSLLLLSLGFSPLTGLSAIPVATDLAISPITRSTTTADFPQTNRRFNIITSEILLEKVQKNEPLIILDVRTEGQYKSSSQRIKDDIRVENPFNEQELDAAVKDIPKDRLIVTYCTCPDEATSGGVALILEDKGFKDVRALKGGYFAWVRVDGPVEAKK
jgi:rhodanese-related sulfurtransferase